MKILVCAKQSPDSTVRVKVAGDGKSVDAAQITWAISPYDEYAVEMALERKDADASTTVAVVSLGAARAKDSLRQALAMGCDEAILVSGPGADALEGLAVARALAKVALEAKPDVVLCGRQASDDDQGLVGAALAEALGWPHVATITKFAPADAGAGSVNGIDVWKEVEGGHEVWRATGPVVLTVQKSEKEPRYPSLPGIMKAKKKEIPEKDVASLGIDASLPRPEMVKMEPPPSRGGGKIMKDGDAKQTAQELARLLREEAKVL
ncbi:MAG: electron transfer flavoprotein subunit beta/FixA family protein [Chloroflexota bacterium]|nr:electron transfer flavoprotein subunit beta/FixA family protein [Chloroflexota bacterium]MDE3194273.1 electron transfer flavoprotein subunit beta/FixA family protein [Chloroflexota bacterium]